MVPQPHTRARLSDRQPGQCGTAPPTIAPDHPPPGPTCLRSSTRGPQGPDERSTAFARHTRTSPARPGTQEGACSPS